MIFIYDMIKEEIYKKVSNEFGCSVGLAHSIQIVSLSKSTFEPPLPKEIEKKIIEQTQINFIIEDSVWEGCYQRLRRGVLSAEKSGGRKTKELTMYKRLKSSIK